LDVSLETPENWTEFSLDADARVCVGC
jgi:hypothetical protein